VSDDPGARSGQPPGGGSGRELGGGSGRFRAEVRDWLRAHVPARPLPSVDTAEGFAAHREWEHELAAARLSVVSWPVAYGGRDAPLLDWLVFEEEYYAAAAPVRVGQNGLFLLAPTLFAHGTAEQLDRVLPPMATAAEVWAQAWSEPDAGSDLAAIRATATAADGGWLLSGTKTWSSRAAFADKAFGLFRSEPGAQRHRGLTYLMFDLRAPGVTVRPIRQLGGRTGFAEIFLDQVFAPAVDVIGEPGDGWRVAMSTASHERGMSLRSPGRSTPRCGTGWWTRGSAPGPTGCTPTRPPPGLRRVAAWARSPASARCSGPNWTSPCTKPRSTCSGPGPSWPPPNPAGTPGSPVIRA
jgi:acyl-CoA dehydrogenase-like protein